MPELNGVEEIIKLLDPENKEEFSHEKITEQISNKNTSSLYLLESNIVSGYEANFKDGKLSVEGQINSEEFNPKLASGRDYVKMFTGIYETIYRLTENKDLDFDELEINIENTVQSCYTIEASEIREKSLERKNNVKRDYLSSKSNYNNSETYQEHLINNIGQTTGK